MSKLKVPVTPHDHVQGDPDAPVTLVEYGDYQCPHCRLAHFVIKRLQQHYDDQLSLVFRHFPLVQIHPHAETAAEAAEFAGLHGLFWDMHDGIYENQDQLSVPFLFELAEELGLPAADLQRALESHELLGMIREDFSGGVRSGVNGTPTFFINGERHDGSYGFEDLVTAIDEKLLQRRRAA